MQGPEPFHRLTISATNHLLPARGARKGGHLPPTPLEVKMLRIFNV